jgi:squalene cyclase
MKLLLTCTAGTVLGLAAVVAYLEHGAKFERAVRGWLIEKRRLSS